MSYNLRGTGRRSKPQKIGVSKYTPKPKPKKKQASPSASSSSSSDSSSSIHKDQGKEKAPSTPPRHKRKDASIPDKEPEQPSDGEEETTDAEDQEVEPPDVARAKELAKIQTELPTTHPRANTDGDAGSPLLTLVIALSESEKVYSNAIKAAKEKARERATKEAKGFVGRDIKESRYIVAHKECIDAAKKEMRNNLFHRLEEQIRSTSELFGSSLYSKLRERYIKKGSDLKSAIFTKTKVETRRHKSSGSSDSEDTAEDSDVERTKKNDEYQAQKNLFGMASMFADECARTCQEIATSSNAPGRMARLLIGELNALDKWMQSNRSLKEHIAMMIREFIRDGASAIGGAHRNVLLLGPAGTGKTSVARRIAMLFAHMGMYPRMKKLEDLDVVSRSDLIGTVEGSTAPKTRQFVFSNLGKCVLIDEAYSLYTGHSDTYGSECISALVKYLDELPSAVCIFAAGYGNRMQRFISQNEGIARRFPISLSTQAIEPDVLFRLTVNNMCTRGIKVIENTSAWKALARLVRSFYDAKYFESKNAEGAEELARILASSMMANSTFGDLGVLQGVDVLESVPAMWSMMTTKQRLGMVKTFGLPEVGSATEGFEQYRKTTEFALELARDPTYEEALNEQEAAVAFKAFYSVVTKSQPTATHEVPTKDRSHKHPKASSSSEKSSEDEDSALRASNPRVDVELEKESEARQMADEYAINVITKAVMGDGSTDKSGAEGDVELTAKYCRLVTTAKAARHKVEKHSFACKDGCEWVPPQFSHVCARDSTRLKAIFESALGKSEVEDDRVVTLVTTDKSKYGADSDTYEMHLDIPGVATKTYYSHSAEYTNFFKEIGYKPEFEVREAELYRRYKAKKISPRDEQTLFKTQEIRSKLDRAYAIESALLSVYAKHNSPKKVPAL